MEVMHEYPTRSKIQTSKNDLTLFSEEIIIRSLKLLYSFFASTELESTVELDYDLTNSKNEESQSIMKSVLTVPYNALHFLRLFFI